MPGVHPRARLVWMSLPEHFVPWRVVKAQWLDGEHVLREEEIKGGTRRVDGLRGWDRIRMNLARDPHMPRPGKQKWWHRVIEFLAYVASLIGNAAPWS